MRWLAAVLTAWVFVDAALGNPPSAGASTFGNPPELAIAWMLAALGFSWMLARARDRGALARGLTLVLLIATILGQRAVPSATGLRLLLMAMTVLVAAPLLHFGSAARATLIALGLALPAVLTSGFPQGGVLWLGFVLPPAALALLVPALFPGHAAGRVIFWLVAATGMLCLASLASYLTLAKGLDLPLTALASTRLRVLGLHPNLAVPHLVTTIVLGTALAWRTVGGLYRRRTLIALLPVIAALYFVRSRTGMAAAGLGLGLIVLAQLPWSWAPWARRLAGLAVLALLLYPATQMSESGITRRSSDMVVKAMSFRSAMWQVGRDTFSAAPWQGFGPGSNRVQSAHARSGSLDGMPRDDHPHNVVLAVGVALGWPGLIGLALLVGLSLRRPRGAGLLTDGALAALIAVWAADAIDMGGAQNTLYPALVFLLLGLREATSIDTSPAPGAAPVRSAAPARIVLVVAVLCALLGATGLLSQRALTRAETLVERIAAMDEADRATEGQTLAADARVQLTRAAHWAPFDPAVPLTEARLAGSQGDRDALIDALRKARELLPNSASLARQLGLALSRFDPRGPAVLELLSEAVALDPYGPLAWQRHIDLAHVQTLLGQHESAFDSVVTAWSLNPNAAEGMARIGSGEAMRILPAGPGEAGIPLPALLAEIEHRRSLLVQTDPSSELRLRMRRVDVLQVLDEFAWAEDLIATELTDEFIYQSRRSAQIAMEEERWEDAVRHIEAFGTETYFWLAVDHMQALSQATPFDAARFAAASANAETVMGQQADVLFDLGTIERMLRARLRADERGQDAVSAQRAVDALAFASR
jgi:tetratricopeptide (TPR) repeat protein/O-antigen ligase